MTEAEVVQDNNGDAKQENDVDASELESSIIRQVEYYFGDMNIGRDKFLRQQVQLDDGWVPLDVLITFKRLAKLSTDFDVIANALNKSTSGLLEVSEDNKKIRRNPELPIPEMNEERRKELMNRTVYAKGFPKDAELDDILKFFKEQGEIENVIMRKYPDKATKQKLFKGSVFATFKIREDGLKFVENKDLKYGENDLLKLWQEDYAQKKQEEYADIKAKRDKKAKDKAKNKDEQKDEFKLPTGTVFRISEAANTITRENIKEALTPLGAEVAYVDFKVGDTEGYVRLAKENQAKEVNEKITDGKLKVAESDVVFKLLEGEDEEQYLSKTVEEMVKRRKNQKTFKNQKNNYKGKGRKRKQDGHDDGPQAKVQPSS